MGAVRPGGVLILEDADFALAFCEPPDADFDFFIAAYSETLRRRGGDPSIGRRLHRCATDAGVPAPELSIAQHVEAAGEGKTMMWRTLEATADAMVAEGVATDAQIAEALEGLIAATDDPARSSAGPRRSRSGRESPPAGPTRPEAGRRRPPGPSSR